MRRTIPFLVVGLMLVGGLGVLADRVGDSSGTVTVEPSSVSAGGSVVVAGIGLTPGIDHVISLAGRDLSVELGSVRADTRGMLRDELVISGHLPAGTYELRVIGDATWTIPLAVTTVDRPGGAATGIGSATAAAVPRASGWHELAVSVVTATVIIAAGALIAWRAQRRQRALRR